MAAVSFPQRPSQPRANMTTTHAGIPLHRPPFHHTPTDRSTSPAAAASQALRAGGGGHRSASSIDYSRTSTDARRSFDMRETDTVIIDTEKCPATLSFPNGPSPLSRDPSSANSNYSTYSNSSHSHYSHSPYGPPVSRPLSPHGSASSPITFPPRAVAELPPVAQLAVRAARDRLSCGSKSGALGRGLIIGWVITTLGFIAATAFWKGELFAALGKLSDDLHDMGYQGLLVFGVLIFITTIPPLPLYSTLIVLSGYTFGVWHGFVASYLASLIGAVVVFVVSRTFLKDAVSRSLASSPTATSLLEIIPQQPHLLLLIRIAPYPYNLLNVVLASAPSLSLQTYTACTALSLCKLVLHTWIGAGIHDISAAYTEHDGAGTDDDTQSVKAAVTWGGIVLCCVLFVYLTHMAKRAIKRAEEMHAHRPLAEEEVAFLGMGSQDEEE